MKLKPFYTLAELAAMSGEKLSTLKSRADRGTLRCSRLGKKRVIYLSSLQEEYPELFASLSLLDRLHNVSRR